MKKTICFYIYALSSLLSAFINIFLIYSSIFITESPNIHIFEFLSPNRLFDIRRGNFFHFPLISSLLKTLFDLNDSNKRKTEEINEFNHFFRSGIIQTEYMIVCKRFWVEKYITKKTKQNKSLIF